MKFAFVAKHRVIWPVAWLCKALNVSKSGFHDWLNRNRKWIADFTYIWTAEGWLYVAAVIDLVSRRVVGWSMSAMMTAQLVADAH
jgi:transposase InsO family protein